jgi:Thioesterase superfamily
VNDDEDASRTRDVYEAYTDLNGWIAEINRRPTDDELPESVVARRALAASGRALAEALFLSGATDADTLRQATALVQDAVAMLAPQPDRREFHEVSPLRGPSNPVAPPMSVRLDGGTLWCDVVFGWPYEGPPGHVHGGFVAAAFDEALGLVQALSGRPGMTGRLTVKYRTPTPLNVPLVIEARIRSVEGRKIFTEGWLRHGDTLCAESEGLFISVPQKHFEDLHDNHGQRPTAAN